MIYKLSWKFLEDSLIILMIRTDDIERQIRDVLSEDNEY